MQAGHGHIIRDVYRDRRARWAVRTLVVFCFLAVFGDFIANDKPWYCRVNGKHYFPLLRAIPVNLGLASWPADLQGSDWHDKPYERVVHTLIPYRASNLDLANAGFAGPFSRQEVRSLWFRHWLGTDDLGRDTLAGLIRGCRVSLLVGLFSMLLAAMVGVPLGAMSGYFGDRRYRSPWPVVALSVLAVTTIVLYLAFGMAEISNGASWWRLLAYVTAASIVACLVWLVAKVGRRRWFAQTRKVSVPIDFLVLRAIEILRSIPAFFLLFAVLGMVTRPSLTYVVLLIAILRAPTIIRYVRAESMKLRDQTFVDAARVIGISNARIIRRHIIPNALGPVLITMAFGMGTAVLLESGLSFLGIGSGLEEVTWGKMLSTARAHFSAWWLAIFPGLAIFLIIASFNRIGDVLSARFQRTVLA